ncbi:MAG: radical SAM protein, partial [Xanthomonas perforans]|nr:radical SAM protein [Xanthomonas perforans]
GTTGHLPGRFETTTQQPVDDGWYADDGEEFAAPALRTQVTEETARSIISRNQSPDIGFSQSVNPYRGCEHGCSYCFARPSHAYLNLSPGLDFETKLFAKTNAPELLRRELSRPGYVPSPIALGINTDAYQPIERKRALTRRLIEVLWETRHPFTLITKNALVTRDLDLLAPLAHEGLVNVHFSVTTLDPHLSARLEPRASAPHARLRAMRALHEAG